MTEDVLDGPEEKKGDDKGGDGYSADDLIESAARKQGWKPFDDWQGDPSEWRPADVFLERGKSFRYIKELKSKNDSLEKQLDSVIRMQKKIRQDERDRVIAELNQQKNKALEDNDYTGLMTIEERLKAEEKRKTEEDKEFAAVERTRQEQSAQDANAMMLAYVADNPWFAKEANMQEAAIKAARAYKTANPGALPDEVINFMTLNVKQQFPDYFVSGDDDDDSVPQKKRGSGVGKSSSTTSSASKRGKSKKTVSDLNEMQRDIGNKFVRQGIYKDIGEYIAELDKLGEI